MFDIRKSEEVLNESYKEIVFSVINKNTHQIVISASKIFDIENPEFDEKWDISANFNDFGESSKYFYDLGFLLLRFKDLLADFDLNMKKSIQSNNKPITTMNSELLDINGNCYFPKGIEGYWRKSIKKDKSGLPFPIVCEEIIEGYDKGIFLQKLLKKESRAYQKMFKGFLQCRITGEMRGSTEYESGNWCWPEGYKEYIKLGVLPSRQFYSFIMNEKNIYLPEMHK